MSARVAAREDQAEKVVGVLRSVLKMLAEAASERGRMRREIATMRAQLDEVHCRLAAIEDAPVLTDQINAGEAISEAARG